jgi:SAM-dependent methyltransferase
VLTPARRRGVELIDDPALDPAVVVRSLHDVALSNTLFGGRRAVLLALAPALRAAAARGEALTLLDVGTGLGDIPWHARALAARLGAPLRTVGVEVSEALARAAAPRAAHAVCADAFALPLPDRGVDVVTCSQLLHHFAEPDALRLLCELTRVARRLVVVSDLRRSWLAAGGFWVAARALRFHPVTCHDGVVSVLRGFTPAELRRLVPAAVGRPAVVCRRLGWRVVASWAPPPAPTPAPGASPAPATLSPSVPHPQPTSR